jgi:small-conductance mechanosensitive channel
MSTSPLNHLSRLTQFVTALALAAGLLAPVTTPAADNVGATEAPLIIGHRNIHVFRGNLGDLTPSERADAARHHIERVLNEAGEGWTSIKLVDQGVLVLIDEKPMFTVTDSDVRKLTGETAEILANRASRVLQKVWAESRERDNTRSNLIAVLKTVGAGAALLFWLWLLSRISRWLRYLILTRLTGHFDRLTTLGMGTRLSNLAMGFFVRACVVLVWVLGLMAVLTFAAYALGQFAVTRPAAENLTASLQALLAGGIRSTVASLPGLFTAAIIFMLARVVTQVSTALFDQVASGILSVGSLDAHTAPATRRLVNFAIWLFAVAMAYPYLPSSQTEAFKGLSVMLGLMVSIGASGLVGQIASGMILVFTRALRVGEYVRIQDSEGTLEQIGMFVTRLRTGAGVEIALPNALVIGNVTRNFSRPGSDNSSGSSFQIEGTVTIGYDTPWRQVHAMLLEAATQIPQLLKEPAPFVLQTALSDFYVEYRLVAQAASGPASRPQVLSHLHAAIQDTFNRYGVQIMSPHYIDDPAKAKVITETDWRPPPANSIP